MKPKKIALSCFILLLALDFKSGAEQGNVFQAILLGLHMASTALIIFTFRMWRRKIGILGWLGVAWTTGQFLNLVARDDITLADHVRWAYPVYMLFASAVLVRDLAASESWKKYIMNNLWIAASISAAMAVFSSVVIKRLPFDSMRFQILSPIHPVIIGCTVAYWFWRGKVNPFLFGAFAITIFASAIALTRTVLLMVLADIAMGIVISISGRKVLKIQNVTKRVATISLLFAIGFGMAMSARPTMLQDWALRLTGGQMNGSVSVDDLAILERFAEYAAQWRVLNEDWKNMAFGMGVGHRYTYFFLGESNTREYTGHGLWVYSLYSGGLIFGWILPAAFILGICSSWRWMKRVASREDVSECIAIFFGLLSWLVTSFSAHPLISRQGGVVAGILIGLAVYNRNADSNRMNT